MLLGKSPLQTIPPKCRLSSVIIVHRATSALVDRNASISARVNVGLRAVRASHYLFATSLNSVLGLLAGMHPLEDGEVI